MNIDKDIKDNEIDIDKIIRETDRESNTRNLTNQWQKLTLVIAVLFTLFQLYTAIFGSFAPQIQRSIHLSFALILAYILYPFKRKKNNSKISIFDIIFILASVLTSLYWLLNYGEIVYRVGELTRLDFLIGIVTIFIVLEATRRVIGYPVLVLASFSLIYSYFGNYFPGFLNHRGFSIERIVRHMSLSTEGILGVPIGVVSTFVFVFLLFGAFLKKTGVGRFFNDFANALTGRFAGGPAKVAVISSAMQGTISGSSIANVAASGSFTIPLMKDCGYTPEFAAAVEASASTGGQIMPPIMGAAAFLLAEFTGVPYWEVAKAAAIPATLYFTGVFMAVHLEAKRLKLKGLPRDQIERLSTVIKKRGILFAPIIVIVATMSRGMTPMRAGLFGILSAIIVGALFKEYRMNIRDVIEAFEDAAKTAIGVAVVSASAGMVVGMVTLTGLGLKLGGGLVDAAGGSLIITLILSMISSIILGMGVPTTANYVITSTIVAPALLELGIPLLASHLFVFYFGIIADITPPVCSAVFTGAAIAGADPLKSGVTATRIAIGAFIIPYMFVLNPQLILIDTNWVQMIRILPGAILGMLAVSAATMGWLFDNLKTVERIILLLSGLLMIDAGLYTDALGTILLILISLYVRRRSNKQIKKAV